MKEIPSGEMAIFQPVPSRTPYPLFDADEDTGKYVKAILKHRDQTLGKRVFGATAYYNLSELADTFTKVTGKKAVHLEVTGEQFMEPMIKMGMPQFAAEELLQNMQFMTDYGYYGKESLDWSNSVSLTLCETSRSSTKPCTFVSSWTRSQQHGRNSSRLFLHGRISNDPKGF